jgi:hypothetical protein
MRKRVRAFGRLPLLAALAAAVAALPAAAGLDWETKAVKAAAVPGQRIVRAAFPFRNAGPRVVTVVSIETSCRCLSADAGRKTFLPGEKGSVEVAFSVGNQEGIAVKSVTVQTDEPQADPVRLVLQVDLRALAR